MTANTIFPGVGQRLAHDPGDPLVTSHCPFCGSGQVVGRSDGTIGCDFCGQNYIVRVQPAFPGMPQMPMGPGAASDVGPDGGLMDPGMVGPDGMPLGGGGPPPGEDAGAGGGPVDDAAGGEGDFPPEGDDDDATQGGPPPKSDSKKKQKKGSLRYRGLEGQILTEEQLLRHLAVRASGASPAVMARLRAEGRSRVTADKGELMPYRTLSSGHQVHVGRTPAGWMGVVSPPEPHTATPHLMDLGTGTRQDAHRLAESHLASGPARDFVQATSGAPWERSVHPPEGFRLSDTSAHSEWYRSPGTGGVSREWRPATARRRPFDSGTRR